MRRYLISFADSRMKKALKRLREQAESVNFFDEIELYTEKDLDENFIEENKDLLKSRVRGFGYWKWKPYLINRVLERLNDNDELYYIDAGCHLNPRGRARMFEYAEMLAESDLGIAAFALGPYCSDKAFTKMDLLVHLGVENNESILNSGQICATHVFIKKNKRSVEFVQNWLSISNNIHFIDDSPSILTNFPSFVEHRHDQSVFSILCKLHSATFFSGDETWPKNNSRDWSTMIKFPIWDKRDLGFTTHLIFRLLRKIKSKIKKK